MGFSINSFALSGNLTRDPELRSLPSGVSVCSLRIAHNERFKDGQSGEWTDRPNYFDIDVWGGQGEWIAQNLAKGDGIVAQGRIRWREWQDQQGNNRQSVSFTADNMSVLRSGGGGNGRTQRQSEEADYYGGGGGGFTPRSDVPVDTPDTTPPPAQTQPADDDIPF
ncbi:MAG TPA: single-stranded DNA-binding protein [Longimicrobiales bacterium]